MLLLFDLDGVLYDIDVAERERRLAAAGGGDPATIQAWFDGPSEERAEAGDPADVPSYLAAFAEATGCAVGVRAWAEARRAAMTPKRRPLAAFSIGASSGTAAVLTNNPIALLPAFAVVAPEVEQLVGAAGLVVSAAVGARKPDPAAFEAAMSRFGEPAADTFFVDDDAENTAAAAGLGITAHRFDGDEQALLDAVQAFIRAHD